MARLRLTPSFRGYLDAQIAEPSGRCRRLMGRCSDIKRPVVSRRIAQVFPGCFVFLPVVLQWAFRVVREI
jgi:hypothetical protein